MDKDRLPFDELRKEVLSGKITYDDIVKRISVAIEIEYLKESPDTDFINVCEDFLWEIGTDGKQPFTSVSERCLETIVRFEQNEAKSTWEGEQSNGFARRFATVLVAFALLFFVVQGVSGLKWFSQGSSPDGQQYIIKGHEITLDIIKESIAEHEDFSEIRTERWDELCDFLGFTPSIIAPEALNADIVHYEAYVEPEQIMINGLYKSSQNENQVILAIQYYTDPSEAIFMFEQDATGEFVSLGSQTVYVTSNVDRTSIGWVQESTYTLLNGTFEPSEGIEIVKELIGGN